MFPSCKGLTDSSECQNCDAGSYCSSTGLTAVSGDCAAGYYCVSRAEIDMPTDGSTGKGTNYI